MTFHCNGGGVNAWRLPELGQHIVCRLLGTEESRVA
jgi:hypothetical protein